MSEAVNNTVELRNWFRACPVLQTGVRFNADYVAGRSTEYALYSVPSALKSHENILGEEILDDNQVQNFIFAAELPYGADAVQNMANIGFMQAITAWIVDQNTARNFPSWEGGTVKAIIPTLTPVAMQVSSDSAKYQIQLKINYRRV